LKPFIFFLSLVFCAGFSLAQNNRVCDANAAYTSWNNCLGTVTLANGNRYDGRFENGMPNGQGAALFTKGGLRYIGQFKNGEYNGLGILVDRNMKVMQSGLWTDGKFVEDQTVDAPPLIASVKQYMTTSVQSMGSDKPKPNEVVETVAALPTLQKRESVPQAPITAAPEQRKTTVEKVKEEAPRKTNSATRGNKLALVIGNDSYINIGKLKNAREDARTMAENLQSINYKVTLKLDVTQKEMKASIRNFANSVQGGDEVVIFYAGHGVQIQGANYLLPIDLEVESETQVKDDAVQLQRILDDMASSKARLTLAIIDACRNNPLPQGNGRALGGRGLATTNPASGQMIIFSAGSGQEALDKLGKNDVSKNGLFTRIFVTEMKKPGLTVDRILRNVRVEVVEKAKSINHEQTPAIYDQVVGDFYFIQ
jgi:hypothetical protein